MRTRSQAPSVAPLSSSCSTSSITGCTLVGSVSSTTSNSEDDQYCRNFDNSVSAVSFGLVATAILISMFLVMALFERFLRPTSSAAPTENRDHLQVGKLDYPSPKVRSFLLFAYRLFSKLKTLSCQFFPFSIARFSSYLVLLR